MVNEFELLRDWAINNVKNKDLMYGKLKNIVKEKNGFLAKYVDKTCQFVIKPYINEIRDFKKNDLVSIVVFNVRKNLDFIIRSWNELVKYEKLSIYFVNLKNNKRWILHPFTHNKVCNSKKLKNGLITLFDLVEEHNGSTDRTKGS